MVLIHVETRHFDFRAVGATEAEAREALAAGWAEHCRQYPGADPEHINPADDGNVTHLDGGACYRDDEEITRIPSKAREVWVVFEEWNSGTDDYAVLEGVYATEQLAEDAAAAVARMYARAPYHKTLWARSQKTGKPNGANAPTDWDLDVKVESRMIEGTKRQPIKGASNGKRQTRGK